MNRILTAAALVLTLCAPAATYTQAALDACTGPLGNVILVGSAAQQEYTQTHVALLASDPLKWSHDWSAIYQRANYAQHVISAAINDMLSGGDDADCPALFQKLVPYIKSGELDR
jgi:hypothetical protein